MARAIIDNARRTILVADHLKFERTAPVRICPLAAIRVFVTDREPPPRFRQACIEAETEIVIAPQAPGGPVMNGDGPAHP